MRSEEIRKKISESCKKRGVGKWKKGIPWNKGKRLSPEVRAKISLKLKGRKMPHVSESNRLRKGISKPAHRTVMKRLWKSGEMVGMTGKTLPLATKQKLSESHKGEKAYNWISDRSLLKKNNRRGDPAYREWRIEVYRRDNFKCCMSNKQCNGKIEAHHILSWKDYKESRYQTNNGITLCHAHHPRVRAEEKRLAPYFKGLVTVLSG